MSKLGFGRLPDFIAVGPPRTATTWLDAILRGHVGLPEGTKETHFFTIGYSKGPDWYRSHFKHYPPELIVGEICTSYFRSSTARERISRDIPHCRIICTLRDPVEQLYSAYKLLRSGYIEGSFEQALVDRNLLKTVRYAHHIKAWRKRFGNDNVLVVFHDQLRAEPQGYLDQVTGFLRIRSISLVQAHAAPESVNSIRQAPRSSHLARTARRLRTWFGLRRLYRTRELLGKAGLWKFCFEGGEEFPPLDPVLERNLRNLLLPQVEALQNLLGCDLSMWKGQNSAGKELGYASAQFIQR